MNPMGKFRFSIALCFYLGLACGSPRAEMLLSEVDDNYRILEAIQERLCVGDPGHRCRDRREECNDLNLILNSYKGLAIQSDLHKEPCAIGATKYELPVERVLVDRILDRVEKAAEHLNKKAAVMPIVGPAAIRTLNITVDPNGGGRPLILVNVDLLQFVYQMAKSAANALPVRVVGEVVEIDKSESAVRAKIAAQPELRQHFLNVVRRVLGHGNDEYGGIPSENIALQMAYTDAMEVFAFAHEYGHLYFRHQTRGTKDLSNDGFGMTRVLELIGFKRATPLQIQELEADAYGLEIVKHIADFDPNYRGKHLQLQLTVEDEGVFTTPWSAVVTYGRPVGEWVEHVCAENMHKYNTEKDPAVPPADRPDF